MLLGYPLLSLKGGGDLLDNGVLKLLEFVGCHLVKIELMVLKRLDEGVRDVGGECFKGSIVDMNLVV